MLHALDARIRYSKELMSTQTIHVIAFLLRVLYRASPNWLDASLLTVFLPILHPENIHRSGESCSCTNRRKDYSRVSLSLILIIRKQVYSRVHAHEPVVRHS